MGQGGQGGQQQQQGKPQQKDSVKDDTGSAKDDTGSVKDDTGSVKDDTGSVKDDTGSVKDDTGSVKDDTWGDDILGGGSAASLDVESIWAEILAHAAANLKDSSSPQTQQQAQGTITFLQFQHWYLSSDLQVSGVVDLQDLNRGEGEDEDEDVPFKDLSVGGKIGFLISWPIMFTLGWSVPDCRKPEWRMW
jgi:hypothetical protein